MKPAFLAFLTAIALCFCFDSCSKCYDCTTVTYIEDQQGNVIDTSTTVDDFCTSDENEVKAKEDAGATCVEQ